MSARLLSSTEDRRGIRQERADTDSVETLTILALATSAGRGIVLPSYQFTAGTELCRISGVSWCSGSLEQSEENKAVLEESDVRRLLGM